MRAEERCAILLVVGMFFLSVILMISITCQVNLKPSFEEDENKNKHILAFKHQKKLYKDEIKKKEMTEIITSAIGSRNATELVKPFEETILIHPSKSLLNPFAVVLVTSLAEHTERRELIRETWYKWAKDLNIVVYFFVGLPKDKNLTNIESEATLYGDIILDNFEEEYYKLTIKVLRMLKWFVSVFNENLPEYFVKTDHDVFVNLPVLVNRLKKVNESEYIGGFRYVKPLVNRDPDSKWYVPESVYPIKDFPTYAAGPCYIITGSVVEKLYKASFNVPIIHLEDVYLSGLVASNYLQMNISNIVNMVEDRYQLKKAVRIPKLLRTATILHPVEPPKLMLKIYGKII